MWWTNLGESCSISTSKVTFFAWPYSQTWKGRSSLPPTVAYLFLVSWPVVHEGTCDGKSDIEAGLSCSQTVAQPLMCLFFQHQTRSHCQDSGYRVHTVCPSRCGMPCGLGTDDGGDSLWTLGSQLLVARFILIPQRPFGGRERSIAGGQKGPVWAHSLCLSEHVLCPYTPVQNGFPLQIPTFVSIMFNWNVDETLSVGKT